MSISTVTNLPWILLAFDGGHYYVMHGDLQPLSSLLLGPYLWMARSLAATKEMMVSAVNIFSKLTLLFSLSIIFTMITVRD